MLCAAVAIAYAAPRSLPGACLWFTTLGPGDWDDSIEPTTMVGQPAKIERLASKKKKNNSQTWRCNQQGCGLNHPKMWLDQHKNIGFHHFISTNDDCRAQTIPTESWTTPRTMAYFQSETSPFFAQRILKVPHLETKNGNPILGHVQ